MTSVAPSSVSTALLHLPRSRPSWRILASRWRVYLLCAAVFLMMAAVAPRFTTAQNLSTLLKGTSTNLYAAIGFTVVLLSGNLDLSVGATMTLGGMIAIGLQPRLGWAGALAVAQACGLAVGLFNGLLVAKAKVNSFIVTLGTMTILGGAVNLYCRGGTLFVDNFTLADWLDPAGHIWTPRVLLSLLCLAAIAAFMTRTAVGRGFYLIGGNRQTAWYSGLRVDRYIIAAFILSAVLSAWGGAIVAISLNSANPTMGDKSLMLIVAAVIIGGTSMNGGTGSVIGSAIALLTLVALINGLGCLGAGFEMQLIASGVVLAGVVLYDAWHAAGERRLRGQRKELLNELAANPSLFNSAIHPSQRSDMTDPKDRTFALACVATVGCVAIVAIFAMTLRQPQSFPAPMPSRTTSDPSSNPISASTPNSPLEVDWASLKSSDGRQLVALDDAALKTPPPPPDAKSLPEDDALHWYDLEYAGRNILKQNLPSPPPGGTTGKRVMCLRFMDHPYFTAYMRGMQKAADLCGIQLKTLVANNDINIQSQQVDQAINERPDLVVITPVDATAVVPLLRKLNGAGIPVIASNLMAIDQGMAYILAWTGPDDWGQSRMLAREFARRMNYEGGYCIVRHAPGSSPFFSRTFGVVTELKRVAPKMVCLDMQPTGLEAEKTMQVASDWITRFGPRLKGIASADDSGAQIGINEACKNAGREDIVRVAAGNSKVGMDMVQAGTLAAITCQSAESDGALPIKLAADWFNGKPLARPIYFLKQQLITSENVKQFEPPQW